MNTENEEPKKEKTKIKISGTYGDKVKLHLNGYVSTKYGGFYKIKSVDQENSFVYLHGYGDSGYDYSRIGGSYKVCEKTNRDYLVSLERMFQFLKIKEGSIIKFRFSKDAPIETLKVVKITYPTLENDDYVPKITLERLEDYEVIEFSLDYFDEFKQTNLVSIDFTPYTLEEKLENLLDDMTNFNGEIKNRKEYLKKLMEIIQENK